MIDLRWTHTPLGSLVSVHKEQIKPSSFPERLFAHHSIPAFDDGRSPVVESGSAIKSNKFTVPSDAILVSRINPRFPRVWAPAVSEGLPAICSTEFLVLRPISIDRRFLHHLCLSPAFRTSLLARVTGTSGSHQRVAPMAALEIEVAVPRIAEQRAIAHVLGTLDDKIELNHRMNKKLEAMARALFKSWFVDFDPVRAKMDGRWKRGQSLPGLPAELYGLFPDRLVDSDLGEIPEGWELGSFGDVATVRRQGVDPASAGSDTPYIGLADMPRKSIALTNWGLAGSVSSTKTAFEAGDILFGKLRPYFHKVGMAPIGGLCSTDIIVLSAREPMWWAFVLSCASSTEFIATASQMATGTRMPRTSWKAISGFKLCRPSDEIVAAFQRFAAPMLRQIIGNIHESRKLSNLRDLLLPKLIAGEIRVSKAERAVGTIA